MTGKQQELHDTLTWMAEKMLAGGYGHGDDIEWESLQSDFEELGWPEDDAI